MFIHYEASRFHLIRLFALVFAYIFYVLPPALFASIEHIKTELRANIFTTNEI